MKNSEDQDSILQHSDSVASEIQASATSTTGQQILNLLTVRSRSQPIPPVGMSVKRVTRFTPPARALPPKFRRLVTATVLNSSYPLVFFKESVLDNAFSHSDSDPANECMGLLLGEVFFDPQLRKYWLEIQNALPAQRVHASSVRVEMSQEEALRLDVSVDELIQKTGRTLRQIGWYHSHPRLGIFLSSTDMTTQRICFSSPWSLAVVIDPSIPEYGVFHGAQGVRLPVDHIQMTTGYDTAPAVASAHPTQPMEASKRSMRAPRRAFQHQRAPRYFKESQILLAGMQLITLAIVAWLAMTNFLQRRNMIIALNTGATMEPTSPTAKFFAYPPVETLSTQDLIENLSIVVDGPLTGDQNHALIAVLDEIIRLNPNSSATQSAQSLLRRLSITKSALPTGSPKRNTTAAPTGTPLRPRITQEVLPRGFPGKR